MRNLKILIVTTDYPPPMGGIQVFTYQLEQELKKRGNSVKVLNFDGRNINTYEYLRLRDFFYTPATKNSYFTLKKILNPLNFLKISGGYRDFVYKNMIYRVSKKEINEYKPDLIHIMKNELYSAVYNSKTPYIVSCHSSNIDIYNAYHIKYSLEHAAKIHCVSEFTKKLVETVVNRRDNDIKVIYNFIDLEKYKNTSTQQKNRIITVSRLAKRKNIDSLIKAFALLPDYIKNKYEYLIVGGGPELENLKKLAKNLNLDNIRFTGEIANEDKKIELLSSSKLFILCPSPLDGEEETFGIVYIESQALGVPVVCSTNGGIPEAVGTGGIFVKDATNIQEIADKIKLLLENKTTYNELTVNIKSRINKFDKKIWFEKVWEMYKEVLKNI